MAISAGKGLAAFFGGLLQSAGQQRLRSFLQEQQDKTKLDDRKYQDKQKMMDRAYQDKQNFENTILNQDLKTYNDPDASPEAKKSAADRLNKGFQQRGNRGDYFQAPQAQAGGTKPPYPPGFSAWSQNAKDRWLKENGYIKDELSEVEKAQVGSYRATEKERLAQIELNKKKAEADEGTKKDWRVQQQLDAFKERNKVLQNEIETYKDKQLGGFTPGSEERLADIQKELEYNADQMLKSTGASIYNKDQEVADKYYGRLMSMGANDKMAYHLTRYYLSYINAGIPPETADMMIRRKFLT